MVQVVIDEKRGKVHVIACDIIGYGRFRPLFFPFWVNEESKEKQYAVTQDQGPVGQMLQMVRYLSFHLHGAGS